MQLKVGGILHWTHSNIGRKSYYDSCKIAIIINVGHNKLLFNDKHMYKTYKYSLK